MDALNNIKEFIPVTIAVVLGVLFLIALKAFLSRRLRGSENKSLKIQLTLLALSFGLLVILILVSPANDTQKGQMFSLIGIVLSATIALSSTTFVGNAMAGLMLRAVKGFRIGDFIYSGKHFGRVSERGLFHVEIQTENRDLVTLPNLLLVTTEVTVVRGSGTIVWSEVSLGYDVARQSINKALQQAAERVGLTDHFVHVRNLNDFSVTYRVSGLLADVSSLISVRSRLNEAVIDALHDNEIEIVSPTYMNTRALNVSSKVISRTNDTLRDKTTSEFPESVIFDKAEEAVTIAELKEKISKVDELILKLKKTKSEDSTEDTSGASNDKLTRYENYKKALEQRLTKLEIESD